MFSNEVAIHVTGLSKRYEIYDCASDRLKQFVVPRLLKFLGKIPVNYFREFWALKNVSFVIRKGETVGVIGKNGSGKSTLLQIICGTLNPTQGEVRVNGRVAALLELGSGFNLDFTGRENIYLNATVHGLAKEQIDERLNAIVDFADIGEFIDQPVKTYSSGMLVRLAFAVIAHLDADILVIDEALAVGDAFFTQKCMRFLRDFMKTKSVLFVSHDAAAVTNLCNMAILLERGELLDMGPPKSVCEKYLENYYGDNQRVLSDATGMQAESVSSFEVVKDQRDEVINSSNLLNQIQLFSFDHDAISFGDGAAKITNVQICDVNGNAYRWIVGGERVVVRVSAQALCSFESPIIGFSVKDRLGQILFGDNSYLSYMNSDLSCVAGDTVSCEFTFMMPRLPAGDYSISAAIASGTQTDHTQCHWIHDALIIKSHSSSVSSGLIGIPVEKIVISING